MGDPYTQFTYDQAKALLVGILQGAEVDTTDWIAGEPSHQWLEVMSHALVARSGADALAARSTTLTTASDPGDVEPVTGEVRAATGPGWLSSKGNNDYGVERRGETFARSTVTLALSNTAGAFTIFPGALAFQSDSMTFRNAPDSTIYVEPNGSRILAPGSSVALPVVADEAGPSGTVVASALTLTTTIPGLTVSSSTGAVGLAQESADDYRARCRQEAAVVSPGGAADAYRYLATTQINGQPLTRLDTGTGLVKAISITRVQVSLDSDTGEVTAYYAGSLGAALADDVTAANANIDAYAGRDCETFTGLAAPETSVPITYTVRVRRTPGVVADDVLDAINAGLVTYFESVPLGGDDRDSSGAGTLYSGEIAAVIGRSYPGIFKVTLTLPSSDVALAAGAVATLPTPSGTAVLV